jgi:hypothetical protein
MDKVRFCGNCQFLVPTEYEQKQHERHVCVLHDKKVYHLCYHPNIVRWWKCQEPEEGEIFEDEKDKTGHDEYYSNGTLI